MPAGPMTDWGYLGTSCVLPFEQPLAAMSLRGWISRGLQQRVRYLAILQVGGHIF